MSVFMRHTPALSDFRTKAAPSTCVIPSSTYTVLYGMILCGPAVFGHFNPAPVKTDRAVRICMDLWVYRFTSKVCAWLIDLIHRRKNCSTGMISGWVQKVTEHRWVIQYHEKNPKSFIMYLTDEKHYYVHGPKWNWWFHAASAVWRFFSCGKIRAKATRKDIHRHITHTASQGGGEKEGNEGRVV